MSDGPNVVSEAFLMQRRITLESLATKKVKFQDVELWHKLLAIICFSPSRSLKTSYCLSPKRDYITITEITQLLYHEKHVLQILHGGT